MLNFLPNMDGLSFNVLLCGFKEDLLLSPYTSSPSHHIVSLSLALILTLSLHFIVPLLTHHTVPSISSPSP